MLVFLFFIVVLIAVLVAYATGTKSRRKVILWSVLAALLLPVLLEVAHYRWLIWKARKSRLLNFNVILNDCERMKRYSLYYQYCSSDPQYLFAYKYTYFFERSLCQEGGALEREARENNRVIPEEEFYRVCTARMKYDPQTGVVKIYDIIKPDIYVERKMVHDAIFLEKKK